MVLLKISEKISALSDYRYIKRKFDTGYMRKIDRLVSVSHRGKWFLSNSFFIDNVLETDDHKVVRLLDIFSEPMPLFVFMERMASILRIRLDKPTKGDVENIKAYLGAVRDLMKFKFIVPDCFDEYEQLTQMRKAARHYPDITTVYVANSLECNFRCPGCFIYRGSWNGRRAPRMRLKVFKRQNDFVLKVVNCRRRGPLQYMFYGGEPFLNMDAMESISSYLRGLEADRAFGSRELVLSTFTNGSLLSDRAISIIGGYDIGLTISLDGVGSSHDAARKSMDGGPTFKTVMKGIERVERSGLRYALAITIGPENIHKIKRDIRWIASNLKTKNVSFNIMRQYPGDPFAQLGEKTFFRLLHEIYDEMRELGFEEGVLQRYRRAAGASKKLPRVYQCPAAMGAEVVLRPDGKIGMCHVGIMDGGAQWRSRKSRSDLLEDPEYLRWRGRSPLFMKECYLNCDYFSLCGGGCPYRSEVGRGDMYLPYGPACMVERFMIERAIIEDYWRE